MVTTANHRSETKKWSPKNVNPTLLGRGTAEMCVEQRDRERWNIMISYNCTTDTATEEGEEEES